MFTTEEQIAQVKALIKRQEIFLANCRDEKKFRQVQHEKEVMEYVFYTLDTFRIDKEMRNKEQENNE